MFNNSLGEILFAVAQACLISAVVLSSVFNVSCKITTEGIQILSGDYESPELLSVWAESDEIITVRFSEEVSVVGLTLSMAHQVESETSNGLAPSLYAASGSENSLPLTVETLENGAKIVCVLEEPTQIGQKYILYGEVKDKNGNTLTFTAPIIGFNADMATVVLSEIQDGTTAKGGYEYIELYVLEPGNLSGITLCSANDGAVKDFTLPAIEVSAKDIITVHLRNNGESGCISEYDDDLTLSTATGSNDNARDIWVDYNSYRIGSSQDVILIKNIQTEEILDAFLYSTAKTSWTKAACQNYAEQAFCAGIWETGSEVSNAFALTASSAAGSSFARINIRKLDSLAEKGILPAIISSSAEDWKRQTGAYVSPGTLYTE